MTEALINEKVLKIGIELHRVISAHKLFCNCFYKRCSEENSKIVSFSVQYPFYKKVNYFKHNEMQYCDYEREDSVPILNEKVYLKALRTVSRIFNVKIPKSVIFNRKWILDGSIPKGYQISAVIGHSGSLTLSTGKVVEIQRVYLEEDSCSYDHVAKMYDTARSGLPLLEVVTAPCILNAAETKELLVKIEQTLNHDFSLLKSSFMIRQDINISCAARPSAKIEIKGIDKLSSVDALFELVDSEFFERYNFDQTLHLTANKKLEFLRISEGKKRMHAETDLTVYQSSFKKQKNLMPLLLKARFNELRSTISNKKELLILNQWIKKYDLNNNDISKFIELYGLFKKKTYTMFPLYLTNATSYAALKENRTEKCMSQEKLKELYERLEPKDFFKTYKYYLPRNFLL